jgi:hypothetical protein
MIVYTDNFLITEIAQTFNKCFSKIKAI